MTSYITQLANIADFMQFARATAGKRTVRETESAQQSRECSRRLSNSKMHEQWSTTITKMHKSIFAYTHGMYRVKWSHKKADKIMRKETNERNVELGTEKREQKLVTDFLRSVVYSGMKGRGGGGGNGGRWYVRWNPEGSNGGKNKGRRPVTKSHRRSTHRRQISTY